MGELFSVFFDVFAGFYFVVFQAIRDSHWRRKYGIERSKVIGKSVMNFIDNYHNKESWSWELNVESHDRDNRIFIILYTDCGGISGKLKIDYKKGAKYSISRD
tara:strand:+ start:419 stop:727 length:309 start_codon:yes stop_codon:yes gene_type:complete